MIQSPKKLSIQELKRCVSTSAADCSACGRLPRIRALGATASLLLPPPAAPLLLRCCLLLLSICVWMRASMRRVACLPACLHACGFCQPRWGPRTSAPFGRVLLSPACDGGCRGVVCTVQWSGNFNGSTPFSLMPAGWSAVPASCLCAYLPVALNPYLLHGGPGRKRGMSPWRVDWSGGNAARKKSFKSRRRRGPQPPSPPWASILGQCCPSTPRVVPPSCNQDKG